MVVPKQTVEQNWILFVLMCYLLPMPGEVRCVLEMLEPIGSAQVYEWMGQCDGLLSGPVCPGWAFQTDSHTSPALPANHREINSLLELLLKTHYNTPPFPVPLCQGKDVFSLLAVLRLTGLFFVLRE